MSNVIVVGGGAAGMMAAIFAARNGQNVTLLEKRKTWQKNLHHRKRTLQYNECR